MEISKNTKISHEIMKKNVIKNKCSRSLAHTKMLPFPCLPVRTPFSITKKNVSKKSKEFQIRILRQNPDPSLLINWNRLKYRNSA